jgi:hypothetical protein
VGVRKILLVLPLCLAASLAMALPAAAAVPSFASWASAWKAASDRAINDALKPCQGTLLTSQTKMGACAVRNMVGVITRARPVWDRQVDAVAQGQTTRCRTAIHRYWLTTRTQQNADLAYLHAHSKASVGTLQHDLTREPFLTLNRTASAAAGRAIRVCG